MEVEGGRKFPVELTLSVWGSTPCKVKLLVGEFTGDCPFVTRNGAVVVVLGATAKVVVGVPVVGAD